MSLDSSGLNMLHYTCMFNYHRLVEILLEHHAGTVLLCMLSNRCAVSDLPSSPALIVAFPSGVWMCRRAKLPQLCG